MDKLIEKTTRKLQLWGVAGVLVLITAFMAAYRNFFVKPVSLSIAAVLLMLALLVMVNFLIAWNIRKSLIQRGFYVQKVVKLPSITVFLGRAVVFDDHLRIPVNFATDTQRQFLAKSADPFLSESNMNELRPAIIQILLEQSSQVLDLSQWVTFANLRLDVANGTGSYLVFRPTSQVLVGAYKFYQVVCPTR